MEPPSKRPKTSFGLSNLEEHLDKESFRRVADARREVWTAGFKGMASGGVGGLVGWLIVERFPRYRGKLPFPKYGVVSILGGVALGGFLFSSARARGSYTNIGDVFRSTSKVTQEERRREEEEKRQEEERVWRRKQERERRRKKREEVMRRE